MFATPDLIQQVIQILRLMHFLMDFIACIGTLMVDTGLKTILSRTFGSVDRMLEGKKYPQNLCALRLITEELLRTIFEKNGVQDM